MIKLYFENAENLIDGIKEAATDLNFELSSTPKDAVSVSIKDINDTFLEVCLKDDSATISYGGGKPKFYRALTLLCEAIYNNKTEFTKKETPYFTKNGIFLDISRNAALNITSLKYFLRQTAIAGLNTVLIYMEDMFEIDGLPYFGYTRGRFSKKDIKELCAYGDMYGVELIPTIETFAHLEKYLGYDCTAPIKNNSGTLLVGEPATYEFLDSMIRTISETFTTRTIAIGADEVYNANKDKYRELNGERPLEDVFFEHVNEVYKIAKKYGLHPFMDNDMYFHLRSKIDPPSCYPCHTQVEFEDDLKHKVPEGMGKIFWNYQETDMDKMVTMMELSKKLGGDLMWLGSMRMWQSLCIQYSHTITNLLIGTAACKKTGIKKAALATFEDSGLIPHFFMLPAVHILAQLDYNDEYDETDIKSKVKFLYNSDFNDFLEMEKADFVHENGPYEFATKYLLYNDPLIGLLDKEIESLDLRKYYGKLVKYYQNSDKASGPLSLSFKHFKGMLSVLELKADFGVRLKAAYDAFDTDSLLRLADEAIIIKRRIEDFLSTEREIAVKYYRGCGFEKFEMRIATMASRFETVRYRVLAYLNGELEKIDELDGERLRYDHCRFDCPNDVNIYFGTGFDKIYTEA